MYCSWRQQQWFRDRPHTGTFRGIGCIADTIIPQKKPVYLQQSPWHLQMAFNKAGRIQKDGLMALSTVENWVWYLIPHGNKIIDCWCTFKTIDDPYWQIYIAWQSLSPVHQVRKIEVVCANGLEQSPRNRWQQYTRRVFWNLYLEVFAKSNKVKNSQHCRSHRITRVQRNPKG